MTNTVQIGLRLIPIEQIALIEPYIANERNSLKSERPFQTRIVLIDRDSVLTEEGLQAFAETHGFRMLTKDDVATNPAINFNVEAFEASGDFSPTKPYQSRLVWRGRDGKANSKLLMTAPEDVLAQALRGEQMAAQVTAARFSPRARRRRASAAAPK